MKRFKVSLRLPGAKPWTRYEILRLEAENLEEAHTQVRKLFGDDTVIVESFEILHNLYSIEYDVVDGYWGTTTLLRWLVRASSEKDALAVFTASTSFTPLKTGMSLVVKEAEVIAS